MENCLHTFVEVTVSHDILKLGIYGLNVYNIMNEIYSINKKEEIMKQLTVKNKQNQKECVSLNDVLTKATKKQRPVIKENSKTNNNDNNSNNNSNNSSNIAHSIPKAIKRDPEELIKQLKVKYFKKDGSRNITETPEVINKMNQLFRDFESLNLPAIFYRNSFDINMFDDRGNETFSNGTTYKVGPKGREKEYIQPTGWVRYGLKVLNKYPDKKWLQPFQDPGNWYRVYHGTGSVDSRNDIPGCDGYKKMTSIDAMANIYKRGFLMGKVTAWGPGVYCSPNPNFRGYDGRWEIDTMKGTKTYEYKLQCAVDPDDVRFCSNDVWIANKPESIRPYGILIKEV